jgi:hypothetical protein
MAATYEPITTQTLGSSTATVTFSSIPQTYTDLIIVINSAASVNLDWDMQFNGDTGSGTGTNYSYTTFGGNGSTASSQRQSNQVAIRLDYASAYMSATTIQAFAVAHIFNYSNSTTYKTSLSRTSNAGTGVGSSVGLWRNTAAITQIAFSNWGGAATYVAGSTFTLYGIKAA